MKNFYSYQLAKELYFAIQKLSWAHQDLRDQVRRASLSVVLNLSEGSGKRSKRDRRRFYQIAMGSLRETQACLDLGGHRAAAATADRLGGCLFRLLQNPGEFP